MRFIEKIIETKNLILDLVLPKICLICGKEGTYLCDPCAAQVPLIDKFVCPNCQKTSLYGQTCSDCQKSSYLNGVIYALDYKNPLVGQMIKHLKYHFIKELIHPLAKILISEIKNSHFLTNNFTADESSSLVIPIPLHRKKFLWRGFNQSELLAQKIAQEFELELKTNVLLKIKNTHSQTDLKEKERRLNIKNTFEIKNGSLIKEKIIFLIDDVMTTGSTLKEAAKILKKAGAKEVWGITLAKD
jgi:competence protein ComFC